MKETDQLIVLFPGEPVWSSDLGAALRAFLFTGPGQHFMRRLLYERPTVSGYDENARRIKSDERAGFEACIASILNLADPGTSTP